jgi:hypothetical protein
MEDGIMKSKDRLLSFVSLAALGWCAAAAATDVTVDCDGSEVADFGSITAALAQLSPEGPHTIAVRPGLCVENVLIEDRERLTIEAPDGNVNIGPADPDQDVITIRDSRDIVLRALSADNGNGNGFAISLSSGVKLDGNHANSNGSDGYVVDDDSSVYFFSHAASNGGAGLVVARGSFALIEGAILTGNGGDGLVCRDGSTCQLTGNVLIEDNGGIGLAAVNSSLVRATAAEGPHSIRGNASGVFLAGNSQVLFIGSNGNSVTDNHGPGIEVHTNSSLAAFSSTVSDNEGPGILVRRNSIGELTGSNTLLNNSGANVRCDSSSFIAGDLVGISKIECPRIQ